MWGTAGRCKCELGVDPRRRRRGEVDGAAIHARPPATVVVHTQAQYWLWLTLAESYSVVGTVRH